MRKTHAVPWWWTQKALISACAREGKAGRGTTSTIFQHFVYVGAARRGGAFQHLPKGGEGFGGERFSGDAAHGLGSCVVPATKALRHVPVQPVFLPGNYAVIALYRAIWWPAPRMVKFAT